MPSTHVQRQKKRVRIAAVVTALVLLVGLAVRTLGPRLLEGQVRERIIAEAAKRGVRAELDAVRLTTTSARLEGVCAFEAPPFDARPLVCAEWVEVRFTRPGLFSTQVDVHAVAVHGVEIDLRHDRGELREVASRLEALAQSARPRRRPSSTSAERVDRPPPSPVDRAIRVDATRTRIVVEGHPELPLDALELPRVETTRDGALVAVEGQLHLAGLSLGRADVVVPAGWDFAATFEDLDSLRVQIDGHEDVRIRVGAGHEVRARGLGWTMPYHATLTGLALHEAEREGPTFEAASVVLEIREIPRQLDDLSLVRLDVSGLRFDLRLDEAGIPTFVGGAGTPSSEVVHGSAHSPEESGEQDGEAEVPAQDANETATPPAARPRASHASVDAWRSRIWWEQIPQMIVLHDVEGSVSHASDPSRRLTWTTGAVTYALRVFRQQLDVRVRGELHTATAPAGTFDLEVIWIWTRGRLSFDVRLDGLDIGAVVEGVRPGPSPVAGLIDLEATWQDREAPTLSTEGRVALRDLRIDLPFLQQPLALPVTTWQWRARRTEDAEPIEDPVAREPLVFDVGEGTLGDARFRFTPILYRFRYNRLPVVRRLGVRFEVPEQDAATLVGSLPPTLLGPLHGMEVGGTWGMRMNVELEAEEMEDARWTLTLREPWEVSYLDDGLRLDRLPEAVDVRRLNHAMQFVFRGPDDRINRTLRIPAPRGSGAEGEEASPSSWVPLREISWYLVAIQLYREDGRFFENSGYNWYQWRRVVEEAVRERRLGRGASTISMQLVKNVFLSHERTLERKFQELVLTYWLTRLVSKERILEVYLNVIEWGPGINGAEEAARYYFGRSCRDLTLPEAAWLAAITPAPARRSAQRAQGEPPQWMMRQVRSLMTGIHSRGMITRAELEYGHSLPVRFVTHALYGTAPDEAVDEQEAPTDGVLQEELEPAAPPSTARRGGETQLADVPMEQRIDRLIARGRSVRGPNPR